MPAGRLTLRSASRNTSLPKRKTRLRRYRTVHTRKRGNTYTNNMAVTVSGNRCVQWKQAPMGIQRGPAPFPQRFKTKLPWNHLTGFTTNTGATIGTLTYTLSSPYDPDVLLGGTQALYFDQIKAIYAAYRVTGAKVLLEFNNPLADGYYCGYRIRRSGDVTSQGMTYPNFRTQPMTQIKPLNNSGSQIMKYSFYVTPETVYGLPRSVVMNSQDYQSAMATVPVNQVYIDICCFNAGGVAVQADVSINVLYYTIFEQRVQVVDI